MQLLSYTICTMIPKDCSLGSSTLPRAALSWGRMCERSLRRRAVFMEAGASSNKVFRPWAHMYFRGLSQHRIS